MVVAGEGWHPGVVGIVASRLVERWRRPCVVIALEDGAGGVRPEHLGVRPPRGAGACAAHLSRFGGHRMAAGVELEEASVEPFRRALAGHAAAALSPADLIPCERVDAVVPGGVLGLELAEELERLGPFGMGNPQPTLLVPAARFEHVAAMGEEREHSRFTLVTAGGAKSRGGVPVATEVAGAGSCRAARHRPAPGAEPLAGVVEPRVLLRAPVPCGRESSSCSARTSRSGRRWREPRRCPSRGPWLGAHPRQRRHRLADHSGQSPGSHAPRPTAAARVSPAWRGTSSRAGSASWWPWRTHRAGRQGWKRWHGWARGPLAVASWASIADRPAPAAGFDHLVALDPPPGGLGDSLGAAPRAHLAWGPAEGSSRSRPRAELDLRPALTETYRALRELPESPAPAQLERASAGPAASRSARACARLARVLAERELIALDAAAPACELLPAGRTELSRSPSFRAAGERLRAIERALAPELPRRERAARAA